MGHKKLQKKLDKVLCEVIGEDNPELDFTRNHGFVVFALCEDKNEKGDDTICVMTHNVNLAVKPSETKKQSLDRGGVVAYTTSTIHEILPDLSQEIMERGAKLVAVNDLIDRLEKA